MAVVNRQLVVGHYIDWINMALLPVVSIFHINGHGMDGWLIDSVDDRGR